MNGKKRQDETNGSTRAAADENISRPTVGGLTADPIRLPMLSLPVGASMIIHRTLHDITVVNMVARLVTDIVAGSTIAG
jgi:hypothetical protein